MAEPQRIAVNPDRVVHETIEGETIVIHLDTGTYYSLRGSAAHIWDMLEAGWSADEVTDELALCYETRADALAGSVREFVSGLVREDLVERRNGDASAQPRRPVASPPDGEFSPPKIEKFTDMQYFLLLDPVHEVEATGWPHAGASVAD